MNSEPESSSVSDSVVTGDLHQGNVIHNHYHIHNHSQNSNQGLEKSQEITSSASVKNENVVPYHKTIPMKKDVFIAYVLWLVAGIFGAHRFYLGKTKSGIAFVFTFGFFGIGWLIDAGLIPNLVHEANIPLYQMERQSYSNNSLGVI